MNVSKINPCSFLENPFKKKILENLWDFLRRQTPSKWGESLILNENEALNLRVENSS